jgi:hypothetical protein
MNYVLSIQTDKNSYYGGSIKATCVDEADEVAFLILKKLQKEGFKNILSVEAIDYYNFKGSLPLPENRRLFNNIAYHRLSYDYNVSADFLEGLIKYFENTEEYEKCSVILKKKRLLFQPA